MDASGKLLARVDAAGLQTYDIAMSSDGKLLAAATFTTDVKVGGCKMTLHGFALAMWPAVITRNQGLSQHQHALQRLHSLRLHATHADDAATACKKSSQQASPKF